MLTMESKGCEVAKYEKPKREKEGRLAQDHEKLHGPTKAQKCAKKSPFV